MALHPWSRRCNPTPSGPGRRFVALKETASFAAGLLIDWNAVARACHRVVELLQYRRTG